MSNEAKEMAILAERKLAQAIPGSRNTCKNTPPDMTGPEKAAWKLEIQQNIHSRHAASLLREYVLEVSNEILEASDNPITLRCLHYLLVSRIKDVYENCLEVYNDLCLWTSEARKRGTLNYSWLIDEGRAVIENEGWDSIAQRVRCMAAGPRNKWKDQKKFRVELWIEKDTLLSYFRPICQELQITLRSMHGQMSNSGAYKAAKSWEDLKPNVDMHILTYNDLDVAGVLSIPISAQKRTQTILDDILNSDRKVYWHRLGFLEEDLELYGLESIEAKGSIKESVWQQYLDVVPTGQCSELEALSKEVMIERVRNKVIELLDDNGGMNAWIDNDRIEAEEKVLLDNFVATLPPELREHDDDDPDDDEAPAIEPDEEEEPDTELPTSTCKWCGEVISKPLGAPWMHFESGVTEWCYAATVVLKPCKDGKHEAEPIDAPDAI
jgi:hypothetical protein